MPTLEQFLTNLPAWLLIPIIILLVICLFALVKITIKVVDRIITSFIEKIQLRFDEVTQRFDKVDRNLDIADIHRESQDRALDKILPSNGSGYMDKKNKYLNQLLKEKGYVN